MQIRKMTEEDIEQVAEIEAASFSVPWSEQAFSDSIGLEHTLFFVAEEEGKIAGYCGIYLSPYEGELVNIAVDRQMRRRSIAKQLLNVALEEVWQKDIPEIYLEVRVSNEAAIRLYEGFGFMHCGVRRGFYEKPKEDAYVMKLVKSK